MKQDDDAILKATKKGLRAMKRELEDMCSQIASQTMDLGDLFVYAKQKSDDLHDIQEKLTTTAMNVPQMYIFEKNDRILYSLERESSFGKLKTINARTKKLIHQKIFDDYLTPRCIEEIRAKSVTDRSKCRITAIVAIKPDTLVVSDYDNSSVKIIETDRITSELKLRAKP